MGGPKIAERNVQCWNTALDEAKKHKDIMLEAIATRCVGSVATQYG